MFNALSKRFWYAPSLDLLPLTDDRASSIFLTEKIDCGPILKRRKFPPPPNCEQIDHFYDSAARAFVLVETLKDFVKHGEWRYADTLNKGGGVFYIIHPVLKHLAILNATKA